MIYVGLCFQTIGVALKPPLSVALPLATGLPDCDRRNLADHSMFFKKSNFVSLGLNL